MTGNGSGQLYSARSLPFTPAPLGAMASAVPRVLATAGIHAATRCADSPSAVASDRFHGALAPNDRLRPKNIPTRSADHAEAPPAAAPARLSWAWLLKRVFDIAPGTLPPLRRPLEDHRRHLTSLRHREILAHLGLPAGHRCDPRPGPSTDSNWPDLPRISDPIRFSP